MELYSDISKDSSSSASYSYSSNYDQYHQETRSRKPPPPAFHSALHSVRKNIITKKPIAPMPPTRPKIYKVGPLEFKDVVQKLTAAPDFQQSRLQEIAPPPLSLSPQRRPLEADFAAEDGGEKMRKSLESTFGTLSPLGFSLSPASLAWCSSMLLSPGTLATFEPSVVL